MKSMNPGIPPLDPDYRMVISYEDKEGYHYGDSEWPTETKEYIRELNKHQAEDSGIEEGSRAEYLRLLEECKGDGLELDSVSAAIQELKKQYGDSR
jgi:hypothetical protein